MVQNSSHALFCLYSVVLACLRLLMGLKTKAKTLASLCCKYCMFLAIEPSVCVLVLIDDSVNSDYWLHIINSQDMDVSLAIILLAGIHFYII